jgi:hypothetical protein
MKYKINKSIPTETDARLKILIEQNNKICMAAEITTLQDHVEERTSDN